MDPTREDDDMAPPPHPPGFDPDYTAFVMTFLLFVCAALAIIVDAVGARY